MKTKERRRKKRWQVAVLVRCSLPKFKNALFEMEMWAKDVNEKGMKLEWSRGLNVAQLHKGGKSTDVQSLRFEDVAFEKGENIKIQDLFYDDDGSPFIEGKVSWVRRSNEASVLNLGVVFNESRNKSKEMMGAFKDFLSIVKNPTGIMEKVSRKK